MKLVRTLFAAAFALLAAGCGDSDSTPPDMAVASSCRGSLSGAVSETILACRVTWDEMSGIAEVGNDGAFTVSDPTQIIADDTFGFAITVEGDAYTGTLSRAVIDGYAAGVNVPSDGGFDSYVANYSNQPNAPPNVGVLSADITSIVTDLVNGSESRWIVHGNLTATLVHIKTDGTPAGGAEVQFALDF